MSIEGIIALLAFAASMFFVAGFMWLTERRDRSVRIDPTESERWLNERQERDGRWH